MAYYVNMTDKFMSGWGLAPGRSVAPIRAGLSAEIIPREYGSPAYNPPETHLGYIFSAR